MIARYMLNDAFIDAKKFGEDAIVVAQDYHKGKDKGNGKKFLAPRPPDRPHARPQVRGADG